jgi:PGF-CTERM protein
MPHTDSDGDETYDFVESDGSDDGPYTEDGGAVTDSGDVTVSASVTLSDQPSSGTAVVIDRVDLSEGGFVTVHDATVLDGDTFDSVAGTSEYLEAGVHENVTVTLDERLTSGQTLIAMPHMDSDGNQNYTFVEDDGGADGPFTYNGSAVVDPAEVTIEASIGFDAQSTNGSTVTISEVTLQDGGFVTVHDDSLLDGAVFDSIRGTSEYLGPGTHENVTVTLDDPVEENTTLIPMAHRDTDGDEAYTFEESGGSADGAYVGDGGGAVVASAQVTYENMGGMDDNMTEEEPTDGMTDEMTDMENGTATPTSGGSGPGFTAVAALLAIVGAALLAARKR